MMCGGSGSSTKIYLVEAAVTCVINQLNGHVGPVSNATYSSVGQVEGNAIVAGRRGAGKVSNDLLLSG